MTNKRQAFKPANVCVSFVIKRFVWERLKLFILTFLVAITNPLSVCGKNEAPAIFIHVQLAHFKAYDAVR